MGGRTHLLFRRIPNNVCRCFPLNNEEYNSPLLRCGLGVETPFHRGQYGKGRGEGGLNREKPDKYDLSQAIKVNTSRHEPCWQHMPLMTTALYLCDLPPQAHNSSLIRRKTSDESQWRHVLHIPGQSCSKLSRSSKIRTVWKTITARRSLRRHDD